MSNEDSTGKVHHKNALQDSLRIWYQRFRARTPRALSSEDQQGLKESYRVEGDRFYSRRKHPRYRMHWNPAQSIASSGTWT